MKARHALIGALMLCSLAGCAGAGEKYNLRVLYIGDTGTPRAQEFEQFLQGHFVETEAVAREEFDPSSAENWDVVLLDWPQPPAKIIEPGKIMIGRMGDPRPLGERKSWTKPTVLLGSAGARLAVAWKISGGYG